jgi:hypothetical protein
MSWGSDTAFYSTAEAMPAGDPGGSFVGDREH